MQVYPMPIIKGNDAEKMLEQMLEGIGANSSRYRLEQHDFEVVAKYGHEVEDYNPVLLGDWRFIADDSCEQIYFDINIDGIWYASHFYFVCYEDVVNQLMAAEKEQIEYTIRPIKF